jgi:putative Mg2+ transporter-C (MgtC) family protein
MDQFDQWLHYYLPIFGESGEAVFRLLLAAVAGGIIGLEREISGREAGFRTNLLVCLGSALVMVVSIRFANTDWNPIAAYNINIDPGRIAYGVMTGIGFLGAGTILKHEASVRGLTTAASLWCVAAIGLATGLGMYALSIVASLMVVFALWSLNTFEDHIPRRRYRKLTLRAPWRDHLLSDLRRQFEAAGIPVMDLGYVRKVETESVEVHVLVLFKDKKDHQILEEQLHTSSEFTLVASEGA